MAKVGTEKADIRALIDKTQQYLPSETLALIEDAYEYIAAAYPHDAGHAIETAITVAEFQLDEKCIAAALLHMAPTHSEKALAEIEARFGPEVGQLVEGLVKLRRVSWPEDRKARKGTSSVEEHAESLRKMLMAMCEDIRVVFIKLACRLQEMHALKRMPPAKRYSIAQDTMEIYAPVAHRLGIWQMKWQLEDLAFRYLEPKRYREIVRLVAARREERERYIAQVTRILKDELHKAGIEAEVSGRPKHIYSISRKIEKYADQGKEFSDIYDLLGFRVLVESVPDCYSALGVIHSLWHPLTKEFDDYIVHPRGSVYQSLHTTVMCMGTTPLEIRIRTHQMHRIAEYGLAAHWRYKEGAEPARPDGKFEKKMAGLHQLLDWYKDLGGVDFVDSVRADVLGDSVLVYTPKGDIKDLPRGSTPLDFAYRIHTDMGHRCIGAKVNGKMVPLTYQLQSGDIVEILSAKGDRGPSRDWLNLDLGYLNSSHAREKVRQWFRKQERGENVQRGRDLLEKELRRLGVSTSEEELADLFKKDSAEEFLAAIGSGDISTHQIANRLEVQEEKPLPQVTPLKPSVSSAVKVMGVGDLLTQLAPCCSPMPGDAIIGYVTRTKGISVHRKDCPNVARVDDPNRLIKVEWGKQDQLFSVPVHIEAIDRVGLLRDISAVVADEGVNIEAASTVDQSDQTTLIILTLQTKGIRQLSRLFSKLEGVRGVIGVTRHT